MSLVNLVLLNADTKSSDGDCTFCMYESNEDCPLARALNRIIEPKYKASCGTSEFALWDGRKAYEGVEVFRGGFRFGYEQFCNLRDSGKDMVRPVEIPYEFLR